MSDLQQPGADDALALALARRLQEHESDRPAPEWEALVRGEMSAAEASRLREEEGEDPDEVAAAAKLFRPFDAGETAGLIDGLLARTGSSAGEESPEAPPVEASASALGPAEVSEEREESVPNAKVVPLRPPAEATTRREVDPSRTWWIPGGMLVAAAAAILIWWVWPRSDQLGGVGDGGTQLARLDALPRYELSTDGGLKSVRGDTEGDPALAAGAHRYRRETSFEWLLRPEAQAEGDLAVRAFAFVEGSAAGLPLSIDDLVEISESGSIRVAGSIGQLDLEPGRYTIALVVGRPSTLPQQAEALAESTDEDAWTVRRLEILIQ